MSYPKLRTSRYACLAVLFAVAIALTPNTEAQTVSVIYTFDGSKGSSPTNTALTQGRDGQLYGTTTTGGAFNLGAIYKVSPAGTVTLLHSFNGSDGQNPWGGLTLGSDGNFYGTAFAGGTDGAGVLYRMAANGTFSVVHNFKNDGKDGRNPESAPIQASDGNFYGTTDLGGTNDGGTAGIVYKLTLAGAMTTIYNLSSAVGSRGDYSPL